MLQICLAVLIICLVCYYMLDRYMKILDLTLMIMNDFYKRIDYEFQKRKMLAQRFVEDARELLDDKGDLFDKKDEELFESIIIEANKILDDDLILFSKEFNEHMDKVKSELLWDWWHINKFDVFKYLDKKFVNFITGK